MKAKADSQICNGRLSQASREDDPERRETKIMFRYGAKSSLVARLFKERWGPGYDPDMSRDSGPAHNLPDVGKGATKMKSNSDGRSGYGGVEEGRLPWETGLVSIIMPAYNAENVLAEAIDSVLAQSFTTWELLLIDDGSTDDTLSLARECAARDPRIRVIQLTQNGGVAKARNAGIQAAKGQYLAFLDSDDLWMPEKLRTQTEFMRRNGAEFSFSRYRRFRTGEGAGKEVRIPDKLSYEDLLKGNFIGCLTVMIDRSYIPSLTMPTAGHEDYITWLQILREGHTAWGIQADLARYRFSSLSVSGAKPRSALWTWRIYRKIERLSFIKAAWCFFLYSLRGVASRLGY